MLTTRQTPPSGRFRGGHRRRGNPTPADKELLKERRAQIKSQQKPVPRKLRLAFGGASPIQAGPRKETQGKGVPRARKVHGLKRGNLRIALALVAGALLVAAAAAGATLSSSGGEPVAATKQQSQAAASSAHQLRSAKPAPAATAESDRELMLVVAGLVALRDKGLMSGKPEEMKHIHAVGSPALAVDNAVMDKMRQAGLHLEGLTTKLSEVEVLPLDDKNQAVVEANSRQGSYRYVDDEGNSVLSVKKPDIQRIRMLLRVNDGVWRIWEVTAAR